MFLWAFSMCKQEYGDIPMRSSEKIQSFPIVDRFPIAVDQILPAQDVSEMPMTALISGLDTGSPIPFSLIFLRTMTCFGVRDLPLGKEIFAHFD
jgi:hypothetical protein